MIKADDILNLMEANKPSFGRVDKFNYAVKIDTLDSNDFYTQILGRQLEDLKKVKDWQKDAKIAYIGAKGKSTMTAVKQWVKDNNPKEFYAHWQADSNFYKDDSVKIAYK